MTPALVPLRDVAGEEEGESSKMKMRRKRTKRYRRERPMSRRGGEGLMQASNGTETEGQGRRELDGRVARPEEEGRDAVSLGN